MSDTRPTPETDALAVICYGEGGTVSCSQCNESAKQLDAMREVIKEAHEALAKANDLLERAGREDGTTWEPGQSWIFWEDKCSAKNDVQSLRATLSKLKPFLP